MHTRTSGRAPRRLTIVQVMSNWPDARPLPPTNQGGTEKIVTELTETLVRRGHRVTVFAPRGSRTSARLVPFPAGMRDRDIARFVGKRLPPGTDVIHDHTFTSAIGTVVKRIPTVCTMHLPVQQRVAHPVYVSERARQVMGKGRGHVIYNGINPADYEWSEKKLGFLLFMGRILPEKGVAYAVQVAEATGRKLVLAGPIKNRHYFDSQLAPRIRSNPNIRYVGAVGGRRKQALLKYAGCVLFPSVWEEPFGLVMVEAMASGTPVLAFRRGAAPEVLERFPGLICGGPRDMIRKVKEWNFPSPAALRHYVQSRFTTGRMTSRYEQLYRHVMQRRVRGR